MDGGSMSKAPEPCNMRKGASAAVQRTLQKMDVHVSLWKAGVGLHAVEAVEQDHAAGQEGAQEQAFAH